MICVPFLGSESVLQESHNRYYGGLEVSALISAPTSKLDASRLASKRQCSHAFTLQQESVGRFSRVAGMCHGGAKAPVAGQDVDGPRLSVRTLDAAGRTPDVPKVQFFAPSKPIAQKASRVKPLIRNFEEQLAVLERMQLLRRAVDTCEEAQETHKFHIDVAGQKESYHVSVRQESSNQAVYGPLTSFQDSLEKQLNGASPLAPHSNHSRAGLIETMHSSEANVGGNTPVVWNELVSGGRRRQLSEDYTGLVLYNSNQMSNEPNSFWIKGSHHKDVLNGTVRSKQLDELQRKQQETDGFPPEREHNESKHLDNEDLRTWNRNVLKQFRDTQAAYSASDFVSSGSSNGTSVIGFPVDRQDHGRVGLNEGDREPVSGVAGGVEAEESINVASTASKVPPIRMPVYRTSTPLQRSLSDSIFYLESLGADCSRLFRDDPTTMKCTIKQLRALVCALERLGLKSNDLGRIFNLCPRILHLKPSRDLREVMAFLVDEVGLPRKDLGKVIRRCPRLLVSDIQKQLQPTLSFLLTLGYSKMGQVISNNPTLLSCSVERKLLPKLRFLESLGFSYREAASMVVRFPAIFNYSVSDNLQPKYDYLVHEIGARNKELLAFPQYFGYSLETRIRPRYERIAQLDLSLSIQAILKLSDAEFNARFPPSRVNCHPLKVFPVLPEMSDVEEDISHGSKALSCGRSEGRVLVSV